MSCFQLDGILFGWTLFCLIGQKWNFLFVCCRWNIRMRNGRDGPDLVSPQSGNGAGLLYSSSDEENELLRKAGGGGGHSNNSKPKIHGQSKKKKSSSSKGSNSGGSSGNTTATTSAGNSSSTGGSHRYLLAQHNHHISPNEEMESDNTYAEAMLFPLTSNDQNPAFNQGQRSAQFNTNKIGEIVNSDLWSYTEERLILIKIPRKNDDFARVFEAMRALNAIRKLTGKLRFARFWPCFLFCSYKILLSSVRLPSSFFHKGISEMFSRKTQDIWVWNWNLAKSTHYQPLSSGFLIRFLPYNKIVQGFTPLTLSLSYSVPS